MRWERVTGRERREKERKIEDYYVLYFQWLTSIQKRDIGSIYSVLWAQFADLYLSDDEAHLYLNDDEAKWRD